jgi:hypothetical protein
MDASFLYLETPEMPMHVGSMAIFRLPDDYKGDFFEDFKAMTGSRLPPRACPKRKTAMIEMPELQFAESNAIRHKIYLCLATPLSPTRHAHACRSRR